MSDMVNETAETTAEGLVGESLPLEAADRKVPDTRVPVLVVDDDAAMRRSLSRLISCDPRLRVVGEAANGEDSVTLVHALHPEVVIMDVRMPVMDGVQATKMIKERHPSMIVIGVSAYSEDENKRDMLDAGACVFLEKSSAGDSLPRAINRCLLACGMRCASGSQFGGYCSCSWSAGMAATA